MAKFDGWKGRSKADKNNQIPGKTWIGCENFAYELQWDWAKCPKEIDGYRISGLAWSDGLLYAAVQGGAHPVAVFRSDGTFLRFLGETLQVGKAHGISVSAAHIWLTDEGKHCVYCLDKDGNCQITLGTPGAPSDTGADITLIDDDLSYLTVRSAAEPFNRPCKCIEGADGAALACDGLWNAAIHRFSADGTYCSSFGAPGMEIGEFNVPHSLCLDMQGRLWVADRDNDRVQIFSEEGKHLYTINRLIYPCDLCTDGEYMFVAEYDGRVSVFDEGFHLRGQIGYCGSPYRIHSITADSACNLYLGIHGTYRIVKLARTR